MELDTIVRLFCYLDDKDLFHESYRRMLCKRLLSKRDRNDDLERSMISKLKVCTCSMPVTVLGELSGGKSSHARWTGECGVPLHEQARGDVQRHGHIDGGYPKV